MHWDLILLASWFIIGLLGVWLLMRIGQAMEGASRPSLVWLSLLGPAVLFGVILISLDYTTKPRP